MKKARCHVPRSPLSLDEAEAVIGPYFEAVRDVFRKSTPKTSSVKLEVARWVRDGPRHFAATEETGRRVVVAPDFAELPEDTILAILSHEFGHAVDFLYPGDYVLIEDEELVRMPEIEKDKELDPIELEAVLARASAWDRRGKDTVERTADAIAEHVTGRRIGYAGPCELQSFERGRRPRRLGLR